MRRRSQIGDRIDALDVQMGDVQIMLQSLAPQMQQQSLIMSEIEQTNQS